MHNMFGTGGACYFFCGEDLVAEQRSDRYSGSLRRIPTTRIIVQHLSRASHRRRTRQRVDMGRRS